MTTHRSSTHPSIRVLILALLSLALLSFVGLSPASAKGTGAVLGEADLSSQSQIYGPGLWHRAAEGRTWYGAYRTFPNTFAYCIDAGRQTPLSKYFADAKPATVTSARTAWALHTYSGSDSADVQAALSAIARVDERIEHDHAVPPRELDELGSRFSGAAKQYRTILAQAEKFAGPYSLDVELAPMPVPDRPVLEPYDAEEAEPDAATLSSDSTDDAPSEQPGEALGLTVSLTSASGALVPDIPIALEVTGADGPETIVSDTSPSTLTLSVRAPGRVTVSASASVAPETVRLYEPTSGTRVQRVITPDEPTTVTADATVDLTSQPQVTTEISDATPAPGGEVSDEFTVSGLLGDHTVTVVHELWGTAAKPELGRKNDDATLLGTVTSSDVGNGTHRSNAVRIPEDFRGWVYFTETIAADERTKQWTGLHGQPEETGFVAWTPEATTQARFDGARVVDDIAISGLRPGAKAELTVTAYRTDSEPKQSTTVSGDRLASQDISVVADREGKATVTTEGIDMPVGWVTFVTEIRGDEVHRGWTSDWGIPSETVYRPAETAPSTAPTTPPPVAPTTPPAPALEPVAEKPEAPGPAGELPRTGTGATGVLVAVGIVLIGTGAATVYVTGRRRRAD